MSSNVKIISAEEAKVLLDKNPDILLIDVRQPDEYKNGHIPGAILLPLPDLPDRLMDLETNRDIVTYCRLGRRSLAAAQLIADERDAEVYTIDGGIMAWNGLIATGDIKRCEILTGDLKDPEEFISLAYAFEDGSERFYLRVSELVEDSKAAEVFKNLSEIEKNHKKRISDIRKGITIDKRFSDYMESCLKISDAIERIIRNKDIKDILEYSMQFETNNLDIYMKIKDKDEVFSNLIVDEKAHLKKLGSLLSEYER